MNDRFDFEQQIMDCWHVVDDIKLLYQRLMDSQVPLHNEDVINYLLGMQTIYQVKFEVLFETFEQLIRDRKITLLNV